MKRLNYLDGLKGWCAISVCIFHFLLMFVIDGYVGWMCLEEASKNPINYYFSNFPYSILTNNSFPLYIFFAIISFLTCYLFFKNKDENKLKNKVILRYFRFLPTVFISCLIGFILLEFNLCRMEELYHLTGNEWAYARISEDYSILSFLKISLFTSYFTGTQLVSPLWCLHYLFLGSMLTYFVLFIYDKVPNKYLLYGFLIVIFFFVDQNYLAFIVGMIAASIVNKEFQLKKVYGILIIVLGIIVGLFPLVLLPKFINIASLYALGAGLILVGTHCCFNKNILLNNKFIEFLGKESLSIIIIQFLVLQSLNVHLYLVFSDINMNIYLNLFINLFINMISSLLLTWVWSKTITPLTSLLCKKISKLLKL